MFDFGSRVSLNAWRRFATGVTFTSPDNVSSVRLALIDRDIERWSAASDAIVNMDVLTLASDTPVTRGWYVEYASQQWQVRDRMVDDGYLVELELKRVKLNKENTIEVTIEAAL
jgi:hypothetical protein